MRLFLVLLFVSLFFINTRTVYASSPYVLPYPSAMPGNIVYKLNLIKEAISKYWYFGDLGQYKYNLQESDKYLVEAKILFEYKQYLLGVNALEKSNHYYLRIAQALDSAAKHHKNVDDKIKELSNQSAKHVEVLEKMRSDNPEVVNWVPEKSDPSTLLIQKLIDESISERAGK